MNRTEKCDLKIEKIPAERMWDNILTNPLQFKEFREFRAELMNFPVDYKDEITCEGVRKSTGMSDTNNV